MLDGLRTGLSQPLALVIWLVMIGTGLALFYRDLKRQGGPTGLMRLVWTLTVLYSGLIGYALYRYAGSPGIPQDSLWRRGVRSTAHCYSGCGAGEVLGLLITVGLLGLSTPWVAGVSFALAYVMGFTLTLGPLLQDGESLRQALADSFWTETVSITVMELVAIGVDLFLAGSAGPATPLFWTSMAVSLVLGFAAAYPLNTLMIHYGVKQGMGSPAAA